MSSRLDALSSCSGFNGPGKQSISCACTKRLCGRVRLAHHVITRCTSGVVSETRNDVVGVGDDEMFVRDTHVRRAI